MGNSPNTNATEAITKCQDRHTLVNCTFSLRAIQRQRHKTQQGYSILSGSGDDQVLHHLPLEGERLQRRRADRYASYRSMRWEMRSQIWSRAHIIPIFRCLLLIPDSSGAVSQEWLSKTLYSSPGKQRIYSLQPAQLWLPVGPSTFSQGDKNKATKPQSALRQRGMSTWGCGY